MIEFITSPFISRQFWLDMLFDKQTQEKIMKELDFDVVKHANGDFTVYSMGEVTLTAPRVCINSTVEKLSPPPIQPGVDVKDNAYDVWWSCGPVPVFESESESEPWFPITSPSYFEPPVPVFEPGEPDINQLVQNAKEYLGYHVLPLEAIVTVVVRMPGDMNYIASDDDLGAVQWAIEQSKDA